MLDYFDIDWPNIFKLDEKNVNSATNNFLDATNFALNKYASLKKVNKYKFRKKKTFDDFWYSKINLYKKQTIKEVNQ